MRVDTYFVKDGKTTIRKTQSARLLYGWDMVDWLAETGTTLANVTATAAGVALDGVAFIQGTVMCAWVTGLDEADGAVNSVTFSFACLDGSTDTRTLHFIARS